MDIFLVRDLMEHTQCCTKKLFVLYCIILKKLELNSEEIATKATDTIARSARFSSQLYLFVDVAYENLGTENIELYVSFYIRGMTSDLTHLEVEKQKNAANNVNVWETEVAETFERLASLFKNCHEEVAARECIFSAFSLQPSQERLLELQRLTQILSDDTIANNMEFYHPLLNKGIKNVSNEVIKDFVSVLENVRGSEFQYNTFNWQQSQDLLNDHLMAFKLLKNTELGSERSAKNDFELRDSSTSTIVHSINTYLKGICPFHVGPDLEVGNNDTSSNIIMDSPSELVASPPEISTSSEDFLHNNIEKVMTPLVNNILKEESVALSLCTSSSSENTIFQEDSDTVVGREGCTKNNSKESESDFASCASNIVVEKVVSPIKRKRDAVSKEISPLDVRSNIEVRSDDITPKKVKVAKSNMVGIPSAMSELSKSSKVSCTNLKTSSHAKQIYSADENCHSLRSGSNSSSTNYQFKVIENGYSEKVVSSNSVLNLNVVRQSVTPACNLSARQTDLPQEPPKLSYHTQVVFVESIDIPVKNIKKDQNFKGTEAKNEESHNEGATNLSVDKINSGKNGHSGLVCSILPPKHGHFGICTKYKNMPPLSSTVMPLCEKNIFLPNESTKTISITSSVQKGIPMDLIHSEDSVLVSEDKGVIGAANVAAASEDSHAEDDGNASQGTNQ